LGFQWCICRVELHDIKSDQWKQWKDPAGYNPDKFAEPRSSGDPENENLHDWLGTVGKVSPDAVRVTSVGKNPDMSISNVHGIEVVFHPEFENVKFDEDLLQRNQFYRFRKRSTFAKLWRR